ncbi:MAG: FtsX-like permease family protein, partial [Candidatus Eremiobacteraeota bacterium]|nr:FtsX-like permease family protein [Candidatus Eremiobacteraeota bacterium]
VQTTVSTLYVGSHSDRVVFSWPATVKALGTGVVLAMLSALVPAAEAATTPPARTMRAGAGSERNVRGLSGWTALVAVVALLIALLFMRLPAIGGIPFFGYGAGVLLIAAASLCTPLVLGGAVYMLRLLRSRRPSAAIAAGFLQASPRRFSVAIASLAVAVAMMVAIAVLVGSFRATVVAWTSDTLGADLYIKTPGAVDASFRGNFSPADVARVAAVRGADAIDTYRGFDVPIQGRFAQLGSTNVDSFATRNKLRFITPVDLHSLARDMRAQTGALVSEPFSTHFGLNAGDSFALATPLGSRNFHILAVYNDYSTSGGTFVIDRATYTRLWRDATVDSIAVYARPGTDIGFLRTRIERAIAPLRVDISTNSELRGFAIGIFDRTFAITSALYIVSMAIAVMGVVSTLFALVLERRLEIALLRYIGLDRAGVSRMVLAQALVVGLLAGIIGIALGAALAADLIYVINRQSFGWLIEWHSPGWFYLEAVVMVIVAALVAAIYPARVASHIHMSEVLRVE